MKFLIIPILKQEIKEYIEVTNPDIFLSLICEKIFTPENTVKKTVKILSAQSKPVTYLLNLLIIFLCSFISDSK